MELKISPNTTPTPKNAGKRAKVSVAIHRTKPRKAPVSIPAANAAGDSSDPLFCLAKSHLPPRGCQQSGIHARGKSPEIRDGSCAPHSSSRLNRVPLGLPSGRPDWGCHDSGRAGLSGWVIERASLSRRTTPRESTAQLRPIPMASCRDLEGGMEVVAWSRPSIVHHPSTPDMYVQR